MSDHAAPKTSTGPSDTPESYKSEANHLASFYKSSLDLLNQAQPDFDTKHAYTAAEILALPFSTVRLTDVVYELPRRKSRRRANLAQEIARLVYPAPERPIPGLINYEEGRVKLRAWATLQRNYDVLVALRRPDGVGGSSSSAGLAARVASQGPWDPAHHVTVFEGPPAVVPQKQTAHATEIYPELDMVVACQNTPLLSHTRRVLFDGSRLDLNRVVCGAEHVPRVLITVQNNRFIQRVLLADNLIGPVGAAAIGDFVRTAPERVDAWYLPGNQLTCEILSLLLPSLAQPSSVLTGLWLQKNPLKPESANALAQFIINAPHLRTLDISNTELGDRGATQLFRLLADHVTRTAAALPLRNVFLSSNGIGPSACGQIARFLASGPPGQGITALYLSGNPLGDEGAAVLAHGVARASQLKRLLLQSTGLTAAGATAVCDALTGHAGICALDLGQSFATQEHDLPLNYIDDAAVPSITAMLVASPIQYFVLGWCALSGRGVQLVYETVSRSRLLFFRADTLDNMRNTAASWVPKIDPKATIVPSQKDFLDGLDSVAATLPPQQKNQTEAEKAAFKRMAANVREVHDVSVSYSDFKENYKKWLVVDEEELGKINNTNQRTRGF